MGHTYAKVRVYNKSDSSMYMDFELIVDTGSTYTWVDGRELQRLMVEPMGRWKFRTIEGRLVERDIGEAVIECMDEKATRIVVFAEEGDVKVLGVDALEGLRLEVNPVTRELRKVEALLAV